MEKILIALILSGITFNALAAPSTAPAALPASAIALDNSAIDSHVISEKFTLVSARRAESPSGEESVIKIYKPRSPNPIKVEYSYGFSEGEDRYSLDISISEQDTKLMELTRFPFTIGDRNSSWLKELGITNRTPKEGCIYKGFATVNIESLKRDLPETATEVFESSAKINRVLSSTKPKLVCDAGG